MNLVNENWVKANLARENEHSGQKLNQWNLTEQVITNLVTESWSTEWKIFIPQMHFFFLF